MLPFPAMVCLYRFRSGSFAFFKPITQDSVDYFLFLMVFSFNVFESFPWKFSYSALKRALFLITLAAWVLPILICSAISLQFTVLFLTTSNISVFSSKNKHFYSTFQLFSFCLPQTHVVLFEMILLSDFQIWVTWNSNV